MSRARWSSFVSVIVPVFDDAERLAACLEQLERQSWDPASYEVVVVDNGSAEPVGPVVGQFAHARLAAESKPGSYAARNTGVDLARGEVLAFTDADCLPADDWLERGVGRLRGPRAPDMVAGRIECIFADPQRPNAIELYEAIVSVQQHKFLEEWSFGATANLFTWRRVFETIGPFEEELRSGGDLEWGQRARAFGMRQLYAEDVVVVHSARRTFRALYGRNARIAGGIQDISRIRGVPLITTLNELRKDLLPIRLIARHVGDERLRGPGERLRFMAVASFVGLVRFSERVRILCGGMSRRS